jgi:serine/alanine adding enzyme
MDVELPATIGELRTKLTSRMRNKIKHAEKHGFVVEWGGIDRVPALYPVFADNMRNLGTPVYPRSWFENLCGSAPDTTEIVTLRDGGTIVAGAFLSRFRDTLEAPWICSLPQGRSDYSSVLLYWTFLKRGIELGCRTVDLGRCTPGGGTYMFKRLWGCTERRLDWHYWSRSGRSVPKQRMDTAPFRLAIGIWKRLPLNVANTIGPRIVRSLP